MAQVSFTINAVDRTRAAFASINQGLRNLNQSAKTLNGGVLGLGLKFAGMGTAIGLVANRAKYLNENFNAMHGIPEDAIDSVDMLKEQMSGLTGLVDTVILGWSKGIPDAVQLAIYWFDRLTKGEEEAARLMVEREQATVAAMRQKPEYIKKEREAVEALTKAQKELAQVGETDGASVARRRVEAAAMQQMAAGIGDPIKRAEKQTEATRLKTEAERDYQKLLEDHRNAATGVSVAELKMGAAQLPLNQSLTALENALARVNTQLDRYGKSQEPEAVEKHTELLRQKKLVVEELSEAYKEQRKIAADAANTIAGSFEDAVFAGENLRGVLKAIGQDLMRYIFQQTITKSLGNLLTSGIGSLLGFRAEGGAVSSSSPYIVGENGPELFVPSQAGRIIPNHAMAQSSDNSGGGNTYIIDARGVDESVVSRLGETLMRLAGPGVVERRSLNANRSYKMRSPSAAFA